MSDDDDDDLEIREFLSLTEAQQDAMIDREMAEYNRWFDSLPLAQQCRVSARSALRSIRENRARLRRPELCTIDYVTGLWREGIRRGQRRLLKIRAWRATGIYPGEG